LVSVPQFDKLKLVLQALEAIINGTIFTVHDTSGHPEIQDGKNAVFNSEIRNFAQVQGNGGIAGKHLPEKDIKQHSMF